MHSGPTERLAAFQREDHAPVPKVAEEPSPRSAHQIRAAGLRGATARALVELTRIAFADIGDVFDQYGAVIPFAALPHGIRSAIAEYRVRRGRNGSHMVSVRLHSKLPALAALGRHLGMFGRNADRATHAGLLPTDPQPRGDAR